jgi:hypothetical protein
MLDSNFKSLNVVRVFVGQAKVIQIMAKHHNRTLLQLMVVAFHFLNPTTDGLIKATPVDDDFIFGVVTPNAIILHKLLKNELGLFHHSHVKPKDFVLPLTWWKFDEALLLNVFFGGLTYSWDSWVLD